MCNHLIFDSWIIVGALLIQVIYMGLAKLKLFAIETSTPSFWIVFGPLERNTCIALSKMGVGCDEKGIEQ